MHIPPGVQTIKKQMPHGIVYEFSHVRFGALGRLTVSPRTDTTSRFDVEIAPGAVTDPQWEERFALLQTITTVLLNALGEDNTLPSLAIARRCAHLWHTFLNTVTDHDLAQFVRSLSQEGYAIVLEVGEEALQRPGRSRMDREGIRQRLSDLKRFGSQQFREETLKK
jgi:hypothetical protein